MNRQMIVAIALLISASVGWAGLPSSDTAGAQDPTIRQLTEEVHGKGWLIFSAKTDRGDWDLFLMRPDGADRRRITDTPEFSEAGPRWSRDGRRLLYYRIATSEALDNSTYGTYDLVIAAADGKDPAVYGTEFPWASWGPDGTQIACLTPKAIQIIDVKTRKTVRQFPRKGIVQQLVWSPDGKGFTGTANGLGPFWNIGRLNPETGELNAVSETERYNCTPDWAPDSRHILYARGIIANQPGHAELWIAGVNGAQRRMLYAEEGRHIYGGCASPDGKYLLFTRSVKDIDNIHQSQLSMAIIRRADAPMLGEASQTLRQQYPDAKPGPRLDLGPGWEADWTYVDVGTKDQGETK